MVEDPADFGVHYDVVEEIAVATVSGELDVATAPELRDTLVRIIDNGHVRIPGRRVRRRPAPARPPSALH